LLPDTAVSGCIAFTSSGRFTKGLPAHVVSLDDLIAELEAEAKNKNNDWSTLMPAWDKLRDAAVVAQVGRLIQD